MAETVMMDEPPEQNGGSWTHCIGDIRPIGQVSSAVTLFPGNPDMMRICSDGRIFIRGEEVATNREAYVKMCEMLGVKP